MAAVGRKNTFIVVVGDVEIPSDIIGIEVHRCKKKINPKCPKLKKFFSSILPLQK